MSNATTFDDRKATAHRSDNRFKELLDLAREGDECAVQDLWLEFGFDYEREGGRYE